MNRGSNPLREIIPLVWNAQQKFIAEHKEYFKGGASRFTMNPECEDADQMLTGASKFSDPDHPFIVSQSSDAPIFPDAEVTLYDKNGQLRDCSAIAEAMIAAAFLAASRELPMFSGFGLVPEANTGNGIASRKGAVGLSVALNDKPFLTVAFATSSNSEEYDFECTTEVVRAIMKYFTDLGFSVNDPFAELKAYLQ